MWIDWINKIKPINNILTLGKKIPKIQYLQQQKQDLSKKFKAQNSF